MRELDKAATAMTLSCCPIRFGVNFKQAEAVFAFVPILADPSRDLNVTQFAPSSNQFIVELFSAGLFVHCFVCTELTDRHGFNIIQPRRELVIALESKVSPIGLIGLNESFSRTI